MSYSEDYSGNYQKRRQKSYQKKTKTADQALASLMRLCSRAEKSSGDARRLMRLWGVEPAEAETVLEKLLEAKFIDDERFASAYTREKLRANGWGIHKIRQGLRLKGISRELIESALGEHVKPEAQSDKLITLLKRKREKTVAASEWEVRSKLTRYAMSRGYDYETVKDAVDKIFATPRGRAKVIFEK